MVGHNERKKLFKAVSYLSSSELVVCGQSVWISPRVLMKHNHSLSFSVPGQLSLVGAATMTTGGAVANTGLAAYKLGVDTS